VADQLLRERALQPDEAIARVGDALEQGLEPLLVLSGAELRHRRRQKFHGMGDGAALRTRAAPYRRARRRSGPDQ
jgi:hypothetical protein